MKNSKYSKKAKSFLDGLQQYKDGGMQIPLPEYQMAGLTGPNGQPIDLINYAPPVLGPTMPIGQQSPMQMLQPRTPIAPLQPLASLPLTPVQSSNPFKLPDITVEDKQPKPNFNAIPVIGSAITLGMGIKEGVESYQAKQRADRLRGYFDQDLAERKRDINLGEYVNTPYSQYQDGGIQLGERVSNFRVTDSSQSGTTTGATKMEQAKLSAAQKVENQRILAERKARMERSKAAKGKPLSAQQIADESAAIGDKFRVFPDDPNSVVDALNPLVMIGDMASGLGQVPLNIQEGNYGQAAMNVATPLVTGALLGGKNAAQAANNLINPLAGINLKGLKMPFKNFKSEIDWSKWNPEISANPDLINEYNTIEKVAKKTGTWLKNPDGTRATLPDGRAVTPEQWVQSQSKNWEKAYGSKGFSNVENTFRGSRSRSGQNTELTEHPTNAIFSNPDGNMMWYYTTQAASDINTPLNKLLKKYKSTPNNLDNYYNIHDLVLPKDNNKLVYSGAGEMWHDLKDDNVRKIIGDNNIKYYQEGSDRFTTNDIARFLDSPENTQYKNAIVKNVDDGSVGDVLISKKVPGNYLKSLWGNNGMFDMTNPNIYKSLLPAAAVIGAGYEELPKAKEGGIHIDPKNKGKFTLEAKRRGMRVQEFANKVMANKEDYSPLLVKRANFAKNAAKWEDGGMYSSVSSDHNTTVELANQRKEQAIELLQKMEEVVQLHKMMYGGMYQDGGWIPSWMNPKNWGVTDYSDKGDFNTAFFEAKKAGEEEFMYKDKRYNTKSNLTPEQQMEAYGITDNQRVLNPSEFRKNVGTIKTVSGYGTSIPYIVETALGTKKEDNSTNSPNSSLAKEQDALRLYLGLPQKSNTFKPSRYKKDAFELTGYNELLPNEMPSDEEINFYGQPLFLHELNKLKGTLKNEELTNPAIAYNVKPMGDYVMGRHTVRKGKDDRGEYLEYIDKFDFDTYKYNDIPVGEIGDKFNKPYSIYGRKYYKDYGDGVKKAMYYTDKELSELDANKKNFDTLALQRELGNRGYKLPKSTKKDGSFDGIMGDETKNALLEYRKSQDKQEFKSGGEMIKRADGSYSRRGLWDNLRANKGSGKKPTKEMLEQERKIKREEMEYGGYMPFMDAMDENNQYMDLPEFGNGGYKVERSNDRKGKTHKVTGPDGSVKYFGDPNMGERSKSKYGKEAFYARHKSNLEKNPHFRAYARATWQNGGQVGLEGFGQMYDNQQAYNQQTQQQFEDFYNRLNQQNVANWRNMKTSAINNIVSGVGGLATAAVGMPKLQKGGPVSHTDSIRHQVGKIMKYEKERGSQYGTGLSNYGNPNLRPGATEEEAIDWTMQNILPKVKGAKTAMEKGEAIDFIYNSGKDPRVYAYQEYLRKVDPNNTKGWQDSSGNWKDRKTIPEPQLEMLYNTAIGNMKENDRRVLTNKGRDWYYKNVNVKPDGSPSDAYKNTWYGRIWNTNDYNEFDPNNPKFTPRMQNGGEYDPTLDVNSTQFDANAFLGREEGQPSELDALIQAEQARQMERSEIDMELMNFINEGSDTGQANYSNLGMFANSAGSNSGSNPLAGAGEFANVIDEIRYRESRGNYGRVNDVSKTTGAYQFMPIWWADQIQDFMGIDPSASQEEVMEAFRTNPQAQDAFMVHVVNNIYKPQLPKLRPYAQKYGLNDEQLIKLMHYRGIGDATKRLKTGDFAVSEKEKKIYNNPDVMEYLKGPLPK